MVSVGLLFLSPPPLTSRPSVLPHSPSVEKVVVGSQRGAMVDKVHLLGYATHGVPLPLFGLGHDWACRLWSASTPLWASVSSRVHFVRRLHPNSAFAMNGQTPP